MYYVSVKAPQAFKSVGLNFYPDFSGSTITILLR